MTDRKSSKETRSDSIVDFPLIGATDIELGTALGLAHWDFLMWHYQAASIARFPDDAKLAGVDSVLTARAVEAFDFAESKGIVDWTQAEPRISKVGILEKMVEQQLESIRRAARVSAIVILHNAIDRSLWRHARFAMVARRDKAIELVSKKQISVQQLSHNKPDDLINDQLEKFWWQLERDSVCKKWDVLVELIGRPAKLSDDIWNFDRSILSDFDEMRHDCVHHAGTSMKEFDFDGFSIQACRSQWIWIVQVASSLNVKIPQETLTGKSPPHRS